MSAPVSHLPQRCACCGTCTTRLTDAFTSGKGWRRLCARCIDPESGQPRAYTGPYPDTAFRKPAPALTIVSGDAAR